MIKKYIFFLIVSISSVFRTIGEVIVLKKQGSLYSALDESNKKVYIDSIFSNILLRYQWPTSLLYAASMTADEKTRIFSEQANAELSLINEKIKGISSDYYAVNVSNTVYQLFVISYFFNNPHNTTMLNCFNYLYDFFYNFLLIWREDPEEYFIPHARLTDDFFNQCENIYNNKVLAETHFLINCELGKFFIGQKEKSSSDMAAVLIEKILVGIKNNFSQFSENIQNRLYDKDYETESLDFTGFSSAIQSALQGEVQGNTLKQDSLLRKLITVEEEANKSNKALLMRGTSSFFQINTLPFSNEEKNRKANNGDNELLASAVQYDSFADLKKKYFSDYLSRTVPHGIAPFIGGLYCRWDMPYNHAINEEHYFYALFIDKKQYYENYCDNLLIIPPFGVLPQIFGQESLYHAASKVCVKYVDPTSMEFYVEGFEWTADNAGILMISCDPLKHAALFSRFVSQNMRLIKVPISKHGVNLVQEEKRLKDNFIKASDFYEKVFVREKLKEVIEYAKTGIASIGSKIINGLDDAMQKDGYFIYKISDELVNGYLSLSK